jgi:three-Cys-motif partner protein
MPKKMDKTWIIERLIELTQHADELAEVGGETESEFRAMTVLKLSALAAVVDVYSKIAIKRFDRCIYIDALSGPGVTSIKNSDGYVIGSPILSPHVAHEPFHEYHFVDKESDCTAALGERIAHFAENLDPEYPVDSAVVHTADCNSAVPEILSDVREDNPHGYNTGMNYLTVFDNEGLNANWSAVREVATLFGDLLITFPATRISRIRGKWEKHQDDGRKEKLNKFFGTEAWMDCGGEDEYLDLYCERLAEAPRGEHTWGRLNRTIQIQSGSGGGRFYYPLIYSTRETDGGNPYVDAIDYVKTRIERLDGDAVTNAIDIFRGDQVGFDHYATE